MSSRPATPADAPVLSAIHVAAWRAAYDHIFESAFLDGLTVADDRWEAKLATGVRIRVSVESDAVAAYCSYSTGETTGWGELRALYVDPEHQGRGHGSRLVRDVETAMVAEGYDAVYLWVFDRNMAARGFYERRGWALGRPIRIEEIGGIQVTLVRYEKDL